MKWQEFQHHIAPWGWRHAGVLILNNFLQTPTSKPLLYKEWYKIFILLLGSFWLNAAKFIQIQVGGYTQSRTPHIYHLTKHTPSLACNQWIPRAWLAWPLLFASSRKSMVWGFHSLCQAKVIHWVYWNQCLMELGGRWQCGICWLTPLRLHAWREGLSCDLTWISRPQFGLGWLFGKIKYSLEGLLLKLKLQSFGHLMQRTDLSEKTLMLGKIEGKRRRHVKWCILTSSMDMNLNKLREIVKDRGAWHVAVHGVAKSQTWLSSWTTTIQQASWAELCHYKKPRCN